MSDLCQAHRLMYSVAMAKTDYRLKANRREAPQRVTVQPHHLWWIRGMLMERLRRNVTFKEIASLTGMRYRWITNLADGSHSGGIKTVQALLRLREHGLMIHLDDFRQVDPPESRLTIPAPPRTYSQHVRRKPYSKNPRPGA